MIGMNTYEYWTYQNVWLVWILTEHQLIRVYILRLAQRWRKINLRWAQRWRKIHHGYKLCIVLIIDSDQELMIVLKILCLKKLILCWQNSINFTKSLQRDKENLELLGEALGLCFSKPTKACGIKWINLKCNAMKITLENYGAFLCMQNYLLKLIQNLRNVWNSKCGQTNGKMYVFQFVCLSWYFIAIVETKSRLSTRTSWSRENIT